MWASRAVLVVLATAVMIPLFGLIVEVPAGTDQGLSFWQDPYLRRVILFSLIQAFWSTLLSVSLGLLVARALFYSPGFPARTVLLKLFGLPLVVPSIVAVMGIVSVYGSQGWLPLGRNLYGLQGILIAHVFFNMPLVVRLLLPVWQSIPSQYWMLGQQLEMTGWHRWKHIEWPVLRESLPGVILLVFMLCLTSFAVVLTLGGGPASTTLEVAIYQLLRFDFNPPQAVVLAMVQLGLCLGLAGLVLIFQRLPEVEDTESSQCMSVLWTGHWWHFFVISLAVVYTLLPMLAMLVDAFNGPLVQVLTDHRLWKAALFSVMLGLVSATVAMVSGWLLLSGTRQMYLNGLKRRAQWVELAGSIVYVIPPLVLGTGYFVVLRSHVNVFEWVFPLVILINALMGLPFVIRVLGPQMRQAHQRYDYLCQSLAINGWQRWRLVDWPMLRRTASLSAALVCALAMGDLGVIALFGSPESTTLPLFLYQQISAYQISAAAVTALILLLLSLSMFWAIERFVGGKANA